MPKNTYSVQFNPQSDGSFHMTVPALPGCEADYKTVEEAWNQAPEFVQDFVDDLVKNGKPVPAEPPRPVRLMLQVEVPPVE